MLRSCALSRLVSPPTALRPSLEVPPRDRRVHQFGPQKSQLASASRHIWLSTL